MSRAGAHNKENSRSLLLFHGTDYTAATNILKSGFIVKENRTHWLGNGIYFFIDKSLATWWTTRPSSKFGCKITKPAILECVFDYTLENVLDLRNFDDYIFCMEQFEKFCNALYRPYCALEEIGFDKLRCTFFDWLLDVKKYDAIIGTFCSAQQPYLAPQRDKASDFKHLNLEYTEVQVCIPCDRQYRLRDKRCYRIGRDHLAAAYKE